jgi:hypothetical protein
MRRLLLFPLVAVLLGGLLPTEALGQTVEGSGVRGTRAEPARGITRVSLGAPGTLVVEVGREGDLQIEGDANLVERLVVEREGDALVIRTPRRANFRPDLPLRYRLRVASLEGVSVAGSGRIEAAGVSAAAFDVSVAGSGEAVIGRLDARTVTVSVAGSGDAVLGGTADDIEVSIAGSGNAEAGDLAARRADVSIAGSGDATVHARDRLDVSIVGSGDVRYRGNPTVNRSVMGSGDVARAGN